MAAQVLIIEYIDGEKVEVRLLPFAILAAERNYRTKAKEMPYEVNLFAAYIALQQQGREADVQFDDFVRKIADLEEKPTDEKKGEEGEPDADPTEPVPSSPTLSS